MKGPLLSKICFLLHKSVIFLVIDLSIIVGNRYLFYADLRYDLQDLEMKWSINDQLSLMIDKWYFVFCLFMYQSLHQSSNNIDLWIIDWYIKWSFGEHPVSVNASINDLWSNDWCINRQKNKDQFLIDDWSNHWFINRQKTKYHLSIIKDNWSMIINWPFTL